MQPGACAYVVTYTTGLNQMKMRRITQTQYEHQNW